MRWKKPLVRPPVVRTRLAWRDLLPESLNSLTVRPGRTVMTMLGTLLGVGAFVVVLGLTGMAAAQITGTFSVLRATEVTVDDVGPASLDGTLASFPADADQVVGSLRGVTAAGVSWPLPGGPADVTTTLDPRVMPRQLGVYAASPGYLEALGAHTSSGTLFNRFDQARETRVAVLGKDAAAQLGVTSAALRPTVFLHGASYTVVGIIDDVKRQAGALSAVFIPDTTARAAHGQPSSTGAAAMLVATELGAADQVARQLPVALRPDRPELLRVNPPRTDRAVEESVFAALNPVFFSLSALTLLIGGVGIANTTLVAVVERTGEIGLRRALGARPRDVYVQFLAEAILVGTLGGLVGTALAVAAILCVALLLQWTAILDPAVTLTAPLIGTVTGALAGLYPAIRAARVPPLEALHR
ncbi:ABC transporter permease [Sinomonas sp. ASV322]|uniref:ABC transporter permease n=1 Tax=Sinomonas sp. ASV322 TaxID=3041920 RepID=UPI0027DE1D11|nr:ABC transporter permease [Sinomonas sp. ASV322]MDQ4504156.1 ABC transporter permease [Sinomonas sp. ASV322]